MLATLAATLAPLLPVLCGPVAAQESTVEGELGARMDAYLERLSRLGFSGSVLVEREGQLILCKGYGLADRAGGVPNTPETVISMGSISKHFTAALILKLEMQGLLSTDDTLGLILPDVPDDKAPISLHQLLTHTSGLPDGAGVVLGSGNREEFLQGAMGLHLQAPPGAEWSYSNLGYGLLAAVVELVTERSFGEALREHLLDPAGMTQTGLEAARFQSSQLAHGYIDGRDGGTIFDAGDVDGWGLLGSGGLHTTPLDMRAWNRALDAGELFDDEAMAKMTKPHSPLGPGMAYGYGLGVETTPRGTRALGHSGSNDVFCALFQRLPDEHALLYVQTNDADVYAEDVAPKLEAMLFGAEVAEPPLVVELTAADLAAYAGTWKLEGGGSVEVRAQPGRLLLASSDPRGSSLVHPVRPGQAGRRDELLESVEMAYGLAFEGELEPLRSLLAPFAPMSAFEARQREEMDALVARQGAFETVSTAAGRNRFGEVAVVVALEFEQGRTLIEISFGEQEIGSFRYLEAHPERVARPTSREEFVVYDPASGAVWSARFALDGDDLPEALLLIDEAGREHVGTR